MIKYCSNYIGRPQSQLIYECCRKHLGNMNIKEGHNDIKGWESSATSSRHRECPPYVCKLLERVVNEDYRRKQDG